MPVARALAISRRRKSINMHERRCNIRAEGLVPACALSRERHRAVQVLFQHRSPAVGHCTVMEPVIELWIMQKNG
jgi:hypothetical protein